MFAGGAVAFGVAALVLSFVRRTKKKVTKRIDVDRPDKGKKRAWQQEIGDELRNVWATGKRRERRNETYVNPIDVWVPSDLERGLDRIPGPPSILEEEREDGEDGEDVEMEMFPMQEVMKAVKMEPSEVVEEINISPVSSNGGRAVCTYPGCTKSFAKQYELNHHTRYHDKTKFCPHCPKAFATVKDLNRHINTKHASSETKKTYHCTELGCKFAKLSVPRMRFDRKDNWRRHMRDKHRKGDTYLVAMEREAMDVDVEEEM